MADQPQVAHTAPTADPSDEPSHLPGYLVHGINTMEPGVPGPDHAATENPAIARHDAAENGCKGFVTLVHGGGAERCGRKDLNDPVNLTSPMLVMVGGVLILAGALTLMNRGPARWFRTTSRRRRKIATMRRRRILTATILIACGLGSVAVTFF